MRERVGRWMEGWRREREGGSDGREGRGMEEEGREMG